MAEVIKELVKRFFSRSNGGNDNKKYVVECPNHIEGLATTLANIERRTNRDSDRIPDIARGVSKLVADHAPNAEGVQTWKLQGRFVEMWEERADGQKQLTVAVKQQTDAVHSMVDMQKRMLTAIESLGARPTGGH